MPRKSKAKAELPELIRKHLRTIERAKKLYARADALLGEISNQMQPGSEVALTEDGKRARLVDNFAGKAVVWGHGGVRRFSVDVVDA